MKTFVNSKLFHALAAAMFLMPLCTGILYATDTKGYNCVFLGHSFFAPVANEFEPHAERAGFVEHSQQTFFSGGESGTPGAFWQNEAKRREVQAAFDNETVDLVGMTWHVSGSEIEDYSRWIDFAIGKNPRTMFFIGRSWNSRPGDATASEYETGFHEHLEIIYALIRGLRTKYPNNSIFSIPYGEAGVELYNLFDEGSLPEIEALISNNNNRMGLFRDSLGHAHKSGPLLPLCRLVWLGIIYKIDLLQYNWNAGFSVDLKPVAQKIVNEAKFTDFNNNIMIKHALKQGVSSIVQKKNGLTIGARGQLFLTMFSINGRSIYSAMSTGAGATQFFDLSKVNLSNSFHILHIEDKTGHTLIHDKIFLRFK